MRLNELKAGQVALINEINGGKTIKGRLLALGFVPGAEIMMLQNRKRGPLLVKIKNTHIALGRGEAMKVNVEWKNGET